MSSLNAVEVAVTSSPPKAGMASAGTSSGSSAAPSVPQTQAVAHDVVGRRTPTAESSSPVRALNVEDLPEPVDLEVVRHLGGVVVGQVEQDDPVEALVLAAGVEHRVAHGAVPLRDAEPLEQLVGPGRTPDAGGRP